MCVQVGVGTAYSLRRCFAHWVRPCRQLQGFGALLVGAHPVGDRGASGAPRRRLIAHRVRSYSGALRGEKKAPR